MVYFLCCGMNSRPLRVTDQRNEPHIVSLCAAFALPLLLSLLFLSAFHLLPQLSPRIIKRQLNRKAKKPLQIQSPTSPSSALLHTTFAFIFQFSSCSRSRGNSDHKLFIYKTFKMDMGSSSSMAMTAMSSASSMMDMAASMTGTAAAASSTAGGMDMGGGVGPDACKISVKYLRQ